MPDRRRTFVPVVGVGVVAGGLAAVAGARVWFRGVAPPTPRGLQVFDLDLDGEMPLAGAVSLVVLAGWGVLLVTRGVVRRTAAVVALLGAAVLVVSVVVGWLTLPDQVAAAAQLTSTRDTPGSVSTGWFWTTAGCSAILLVTTTLAVAWCPAWPEMGSRYDAPGSAGAGADDVPPEDRSNLDLWKQLDEGRDPTA